jgi:hypothetical protein
MVQQLRIRPLVYSAGLLFMKHVLLQESPKTSFVIVLCQMFRENPKVWSEVDLHSIDHYLMVREWSIEEMIKGSWMQDLLLLYVDCVPVRVFASAIRRQRGCIGRVGRRIYGNSGYNTGRFRLEGRRKFLNKLQYR